jgi:hypothetical protein
MKSTRSRLGLHRGTAGVALALAFVLAVLCPSTTEAKFSLTEKVGEKETKLQIYGFSQLEIRGGDGWALRSNLTGGDGPMFAAQRIRWGMNYTNGPIAGKLFMDFNQPTTSLNDVPVGVDPGGDLIFETRWTDAGGLPLYIKDAFAAYRVSNAFMVRLGMIKSPLGMDFTVPGWNLDIAQRGGLEKALVLERDMGLTVSGRLIGQGDENPMKTNGLEMGNERQGHGFGYDLFVGNPAGRSGAVVWDRTVLGEALAYAGRLHFDMGKTLHVEAAYGISENAGGTLDPGDEDYEVYDIGVASELFESKLELKFEYISGNNIRGVKDREQNAAVFTAGWLFMPSLQAVIKTYQANASRPGTPDTSLGNTYLGINWYLARLSTNHRDLQRSKLVFNYILVNGDDVDADTPWNGMAGYRDSAYIIQWQYKY